MPTAVAPWASRLTVVDTGHIITAFLVAAGLGGVVGMERQLAPGWDDLSAGPRSFSLYGIWGAAAALVGDQYGGFAFAAVTLGFVGLLLTGYAVGARRSGDWGTTTEAAAFAVFTIGALAWNTWYVAAVAVAVGVTGILAFKEPLHRLTDRFSIDDVRAVVQFGVLTAVILPIVPDESIGPFDAINPRQIWFMVVLVSAIGLVGYVTLRFMGTSGLAATGLFGGLVSSTAVSLGFSRISKRRDVLVPALAAGVLSASGIMFPRVGVEAGVISRDLIGRLAVPLAIPTVLVAVAAFVWWRKSLATSVEEESFEVKNPLTLATALQFGALYGVIIFISKALVERVSESSLLLVGAVSGINDVDAITLSTANLVSQGSLTVDTGARVILVAAAVNTFVKAGMVMSLGSRRLARAVSVILIPAGVIALAGAVVLGF